MKKIEIPVAGDVATNAFSVLGHRWLVTSDKQTGQVIHRVEGDQIVESGVNDLGHPCIIKDGRLAMWCWDNIIDWKTGEVIHFFATDSWVAKEADKKKWKAKFFAHKHLYSSANHVVAVGKMADTAAEVLGVARKHRPGEVMIYARGGSIEVIRLGKQAVITITADDHTCLCVVGWEAFVIDLP